MRLRGERAMERPRKIREARGKLGILLPGMGAVGATFIAGTLLARRGLGATFGSLTQEGTIRLGKRTDHRSPKINEVVPLASLDDLVFGGWDVYPDDLYEVSIRSEERRGGKMGRHGVSTGKEQR